jgi:hypothetical protein
VASTHGIPLGKSVDAHVPAARRPDQHRGARC